MDCSKHRDVRARDCPEHFTQVDTGDPQQPEEISAISLSLQIRKLRHWTDKWFFQDHGASTVEPRLSGSGGQGLNQDTRLPHTESC